MKALSIRQPWAWLIVHGIKDIENRTWFPNYRGPFYVHASKTLYGTTEQRECIREWVQKRFRFYVPSDEELACGGIIGKVSVVDVVDRSQSPWFEGPYGFVLDGASPLPFRRCNGRLGFFEVRP